MPGDLSRSLTARIGRDGPLPFSAWMDAVLYGADGFYRTGGHAGRRGDFLTSPEVGPLFGRCVARAVDAEWQRVGCPASFTVVEHGAGPGTLARSVLAAPLQCRSALHYVAVETSDEQRVRHPAGATSVTAAPPPPETRLVVANELLDNLPFDLWRRHADGWRELRVGVDGQGGFDWVDVDAEHPAVGERLSALAPDCPDGAVVPDQGSARSWLAEQLDAGGSGTVIVIDYAATTAELAARPFPGWLRTYRTHERGTGPLDDPGLQDVTADLAVDQLGLVRPPDRVWSQAAWLDRLGIRDLVEEGRRIWNERAGIGDLEALRARSRVAEAEALCDPDGLGAFAVLEWDLEAR